MKLLAGDAGSGRGNEAGSRGSRRAGLLTSAATMLACALVSSGLRAAEAVAPAALMDFSTAGYGGGGVALPRVAARLVVAPTGGDDTATIQGALDAVAKRPLDAQGFRGAVLLRGGPFRVAGQLRIAAAGVILRGEGATIVAAGNSRRTLIEVRGSTANRVVGEAVRVTDENVPAGAIRLTLANVDGLRVGDRVVVRRPSTREWIAEIKANDYAVVGQYRESRIDWLPGTRDIEWERTIVAVDAAAKTVTLDAPITTALETKFGGGTVHALTWPERLRNVGVEYLTCVSECDANQPFDEEHAWIGVSLDHVENAWVRQVTVRQFVSSCVWVGNGARAVTVEDCGSERPVSEVAAWRRVSFYVGGQQVLVQRCTAADGGRDFAAGHCAAGPNVFLECRAVRANADSGPFESWASGVLYDRVSIGGAALALANLGAKTQGAAWTAANCVLWNCAASGRIVIDSPPGAPNRAVIDDKVASLYRAQLAERAGGAAVAALKKVERVDLNALDREAVPFKPSALGATRSTSKPLAIEGGYFVVEGRAVFGASMGSALWKGQLMPGRRDGGTSPTRWAPGRVGTGWTEDLNQLTDGMAAQRTPFYYAYPGLWYDRRRDDHSIARREDAEVAAPFAESPWARSGQGKAWDGLSQYDLTKFNPWYFARLRELAERCAEKGLVFVYQAYDNHNLQEAAAHWAEFAWRPANCLQDVGFPEPPNWTGSSQSRHHIAAEFYDVTHPVRRDLHERYIRHTLDVLGDSPNFILTVGYQFAGPLAFQQFFVDTVAAWAKAHGRRVRQQLQTSKAVTDAILADPARAALIDVIDTRYWQYTEDGKLFAPDGLGKLAFREIRNNTFGREVAVPTKADYVYKIVREYRDKFPDKAVVAGHGGFGPLAVLMAGGASPVNSEGGVFRAGGARDDAGLTRFIAEQLAGVLPRMRPVDGLAGEAWCLADATWKTVLIYSAAGETITLAQALPASEATWFNLRDGETKKTKLGAATSVAKPSSGEWLLLVRGL
ncbi:MAG: hypothetical protein HZA93_10150 [Verrucomicrobia bacterium]|nr:hypothetical protein [Verrucomicrobiota bacterium]